MSTQVVGEVSGRGFEIAVTPTVTASSYNAGFVIGGVLAFAGAFDISLNPVTGYNAWLQSITILFKGSVQTTELDFVLMTAAPATPANYADHATPTFAAADSALIRGVYPLTSNLSPLGTHTVYNLDGICKQMAGASTSLTGLVVSKSNLAANLASTTDMTVILGMSW